MRTRWSGTLQLLILLVLCVLVESHREILLHSSIVDTRNHRGWRNHSQFLGLDDPRKLLFLIHFDSRVDVEEFRKVSGLALNHYLPWNSYLERMTHLEAHQLEERFPEIQWIGFLESQHKLSPLFQENHPQEIVWLRVWIHESCSTEERDSLLQTLDLEPYEFVDKFRLMVDVKQGSSALKVAHELVEHSCVWFLEPQVRVRLHNAFAKEIILENEETVVDYSRKVGLFTWEHKLQGEGQIVGVADSGLNVDNCYFAQSENLNYLSSFRKFVNNASAEFMTCAQDVALNRKVVQYVMFRDHSDAKGPKAGHGTHVAGSVAGFPINGHESQNFKHSGVASMAKLAFFDLSSSESDDLDLPQRLGENLFSWAYSTGARIHSNSWGTEIGVYNTEAYEVDAFAFEKKDFLPIFSAGNYGGCGSFSTVTSPSIAKNALSIGATLNSFKSWKRFKDDVFVKEFFDSFPNDFSQESVAYFSSQGPALDGRLKPDIMAPGMYIASASSDSGKPSCSNEAAISNLKYFGGTSQAVPLVSGAAALVRQYFMEGFFPSGLRNLNNAFSPSASLIKAILINSAVEMKGVKHTFSETQECSSSRILLSSRPSVMTGAGRLFLHSALYFSDEDSRSRYLHVPSMCSSCQKEYFDTFLGHQRNFFTSFCVFPNPNEEIRITLVWTDPPSSLLSSRDLVNDLDLFVLFNGQNISGNCNFLPLLLLLTCLQHKDHTLTRLITLDQTT